MAGEKEDLATLRLLSEEAEGGGAAAVVKVRQGVVQDQGDGVALGQGQLADGKAHGQVQLIQRSGGEVLGVPGGVAPLGLRCKAEAPVQGHGVVAAVGELGEDLRRPAAQRRGEAVLQVRVGLGQGVHGQGEGVILPLQAGDLRRQLRLPGGEGVLAASGGHGPPEAVCPGPDLGGAEAGGVPGGAELVLRVLRGGEGQVLGAEGAVSGFLGGEVIAEAGLPGGGLRLAEGAALLGAAAKGGVRRGGVEGLRREAADLQQDGLLVGAEGLIEGVGGGGFAIAVPLGGIPGGAEGLVAVSKRCDPGGIGGAEALL